MTTRQIAVAIMIAVTPRLAAAQTIRGAIVDSATGKGVARARVSVSGTALQTTADSLGRFAIDGAPIGAQVLAIHTPSLDSLNASYSVQVNVAGGTADVALRVPSALQIAASACGGRGYANGGILLGRLRVADDSTAPLAGTVSAEWKTASDGDAVKSVSATADARGRFALCGVALDTALTLRALTDGSSGQAIARVASAARFGRTELALHRERTTTASFAGLVTDSTGKPIAGAEVTLPDLGKGTAADEQGAFLLRDVPAGAQRVLVRHLGYGPVESQLTFAAGQTIQRHITMIRSTTLDSVVVKAKSVDHQLDDFEVNKKLGLGHFLTRVDLAPQEGRSTAAVLTSLPGIKVFAIGPYGWVGSGRHSSTTIKPTVLPDEFDTNKGAPFWDCFALVYLDDRVVFAGKTLPNVGGHVPSRWVWEPLFEVNSIPVAEIEAIEYYATAAETPTKYAALNSQCGVLVIHTLRYHPKDTTAVSPKPPAHEP